MTAPEQCSGAVFLSGCQPASARTFIINYNKENGLIRTANFTSFCLCAIMTNEENISLLLVLVRASALVRRRRHHRARCGPGPTDGISSVAEGVDLACRTNTLVDVDVAMFGSQREDILAMFEVLMSSKAVAESFQPHEQRGIEGCPFSFSGGGADVPRVHPLLLWTAAVSGWTHGAPSRQRELDMTIVFVPHGRRTEH